MTPEQRHARPSLRAHSSLVLLPTSQEKSRSLLIHGGVLDQFSLHYDGIYLRADIA